MLSPQNLLGVLGGPIGQHGKLLWRWVAPTRQFELYVMPDMRKRTKVDPVNPGGVRVLTVTPNAGVEGHAVWHHEGPWRADSELLVAQRAAELETQAARVREERARRNQEILDNY